MSYEDPHSFLFGLNQFAAPSNNNSPRASGSGNNMNGGASDNNGIENGHQQETTSSMLNGLDVFAGRGGGDNNNDILDGSFADQLELWTNANFSFDGPTGHALLGDEDKDKGDDPDKKEDDKEEEKRAGKRAKNEGFNSGGLGKGRQRDEEENEPRTAVLTEPTHQTHNDQAALQQQQHYFAPPSRNAEEARRPGYDQAFGAGQPNDRPRSESQSKSGLPMQSPGRVGVESASFGPQSNAFPSAIFGGFNGHPQVNGLATPQASNGFLAAQPSGQLDLTCLIALQQLVAQNPLALASLGSFAGLNPQLGALSAQLNGHNLQQLQQQMHQQQQNAASQMSPLVPNPLQQQPFSQFNMGYQNGWPLLNGQYNSAAPTGSMAAQVPNPSAPFINGNIQRDTNAVVTPSGSPQDPDDDEEDKRRKDRKKRLSSANASEGFGDKSKPTFRDRKQSISEGDSSESGGTNSRMTAAERRKMLEERAAERDQVPPLKLIDTGNPEADAEANHQAIEEDKRKRNTAASARFRIKKKQREAALEAHSKEVSTQLAELKDEINKLRDENQWLKGLIQVRPGGGKDGVIPSSRLGNKASQSAVSASEALAAAQQLQALQQAVNIQQQKPLTSSEPDKHIDRLRDTGIRPRGVGTDSQTATVAAHKRDREE